MYNYIHIVILIFILKYFSSQYTSTRGVSLLYAYPERSKWERLNAFVITLTKYLMIFHLFLAPLNYDKRKKYMIDVILFRLFFALFIIPYPLFGGILSATAEFIDLNILMAVQPEAFPLYQFLDKTMDLFYLGLEAYVVSTWKDSIIKKTALVLFFYRFIGTLVFYIYKDPFTLVVFPNVFEWFFLSVLILARFRKNQFLEKKENIFNMVAILLFIKIVHEYYLHVFLPTKIHPETIQHVINYFSNLTS